MRASRNQTTYHFTNMFLNKNSPFYLVYSTWFFCGSKNQQKWWNGELVKNGLMPWISQFSYNHVIENRCFHFRKKQGTSWNQHQVTTMLQRKMVSISPPFSFGLSRFLEAPLVRQADGELKNNKWHVLRIAILCWNSYLNFLTSVLSSSFSVCNMLSFTLASIGTCLGPYLSLAIASFNWSFSWNMLLRDAFVSISSSLSSTLVSWDL